MKRTENTFPHHARSPIKDLDIGNVLKWVKRLVRQLSKGYQAVDDLDEAEDEEERDDDSV